MLITDLLILKQVNKLLILVLVNSISKIILVNSFFLILLICEMITVFFSILINDNSYLSLLQNYLILELLII